MANQGVFLITGAARRIGRHIALGLATSGYDIVVHCHHSQGEAQELVDEIEATGQRAVIVAGDLSQIDVPERLVAEAVTKLGALTGLINNASLFEPDEIGTVTPASWTRHIDINLRAPVLLAQAFAQQLPNDTAGNIINMVDQRVLKLNPKFFSYTTSKAALWTVTQTLAQSLAPRIRVNAIAPGPALPNARMDEAEFQKQSALTLLEHGTSPEEIFQTVKFILSQPALTGQMIALDGGQHLAWATPDITEVQE